MNFAKMLELITRVISLGGDLLPIALEALAELRAVSGMTDDEIIAQARSLNDAEQAYLREKLNIPDPEPPVE